MVKTHRIAVIPGDNIGPEVVAAGLEVLRHLQERGLWRFEAETFPWGAGYYLKTGKAMPDDGIATLRQFDAIYLGAHGDPARVPDRVSSQGLMHPIRKNLQLYVNLRPVRRYPGVPSPLASPGEIDFVVVRENTEGEYSAIGGRLHAGTPQELAIQATVLTRHGCERIIRFAFDLARRRAGKRYVHLVTKSNALFHVMTLWDEVFEEVAREYPDIRIGKSHVDAMSMYVISRPSSFDVIVATNLFGDIISDEAAQVTGSIGLAASANLDPTRRHPSMFEPIHGSAPDIAGQGIANPLAAINAAALMLDWLGEAEAAGRVTAAVERVLAEGKVRTRDLGGTATTAEMTAAVIAAIG